MRLPVFALLLAVTCAPLCAAEQPLRRGWLSPTMVTTADTDDRVIPAHSFKFASALQYSQAGDAPVLIRIETAAGHGGGKPTQKRIEETADQFAFLAHNLGMERSKH